MTLACEDALIVTVYGVYDHIHPPTHCYYSIRFFRVISAGGSDDMLSGNIWFAWSNSSKGGDFVTFEGKCYSVFFPDLKVNAFTISLSVITLTFINIKQ